MTIFSEPICTVSDRIRALQKGLHYDHRASLPQNIPDGEFRDLVYSEKFKRGYACFKFSVAQILKPKTILEIGIGMGIAALAFTTASSCHYTGIDNNLEFGNNFPVKPTEWVDSLLKTPHTIIEGDASKSFPVGMFDLIHVDGSHYYENVVNDFELSVRSGSEWILVDDARDSTVCAGVFDVLRRLYPGRNDWTYFEDTFTGNILWHREHSIP